MRTAALEDLEAFISLGRLWDAGELAALIGRLQAEAAADEDANLDHIARFLHAVLVRRQIGPVPARLAADIEAVVYPRLYKVMEAVWDDLPAEEVRTRIEVMNRRLARLFAMETSGAPGSASGEAASDELAP